MNGMRYLLFMLFVSSSALSDEIVHIVLDSMPCVVDKRVKGHEMLQCELYFPVSLRDPMVQLTGWINHGKINGVKHYTTPNPELLECFLKFDDFETSDKEKEKCLPVLAEWL